MHPVHHCIMAHPPPVFRWPASPPLQGSVPVRSPASPAPPGDDPARHRSCGIAGRASVAARDGYNHFLPAFRCCNAGISCPHLNKGFYLNQYLLSNPLFIIGHNLFLPPSTWEICREGIEESTKYFPQSAHLNSWTVSRRRTAKEFPEKHSRVETPEPTGRIRERRSGLSGGTNKQVRRRGQGASVTTVVWSSGTVSIFCRVPLGQRISSESNFVASPRPMVTGSSDCER